MPKLPPSQVQRQSTLNESMTPNAAKGRTNVVAPEPRPLAPLGTVAVGGDGIEFVGPSLWSGETDAIRANDAEVDISRATGYAAVAGLPTQDTNLPSFFALEAADDGAGYRSTVFTMWSQDNDGSAWASVGGFTISDDGSTTSAQATVDTTVNGAVAIHSSSDFAGLVIGRSVNTVTAAQVPANSCVLYMRDNGSGKDQLCVQFNSGAVQVLATEP